MARLDWANRFSYSNSHFIPGWSSTSRSELLTPFFVYAADVHSKYFAWLISGNNSSNMTKPGILVFLILFGWCFPCVFSRRTHQRTRDAKKSRRQDRSSEDRLSVLAKVSTGQTPYKPHESAASLPKKQEQPTSSYAVRAANFSGPRDLSEKDKVFQQAFRFGAR